MKCFDKAGHRDHNLLSSDHFAGKADLLLIGTFMTLSSDHAVTNFQADAAGCRSGNVTLIVPHQLIFFTYLK